MGRLRRTLWQAYYKVLMGWSMQYRRYKKLTERLTVEREFRYWQSRMTKVQCTAPNGHLLRTEELGLCPESLTRLQEQQREEQEVVIADIDRNGRLLSYFGPIENARSVPPEKFVQLSRFEVELVAREGYVGVRKSYRGHKLNFVNELKILHHLHAAGCHVPAIMAVDFENLTLTVAYLAGRVLRDELAARGAELYAMSTREREYSNLSERRLVRTQRAEEGKRVLAYVLDEELVDKLYQELCRIHAAGITNLDIKYGNIILEGETRQPYWIDFERATLYSNPSSRTFRILCDRDIVKFNLFFGTNNHVAIPPRQRRVKLTI